MNESKHSLIIDDDLDDQEIFLMCVKKISADISCRTANNGEEAIIMLESQKEYVPDYIFLDVNMPKMNGIECLKILKKMERLKETKIFMYSTTAESSVVKQIKALGAEDFIIKPVETIVLREKLAKIFGITWVTNGQVNKS
ncbi:MAG: response regulator [Ferruginibacter sp.]|nr:response regulator [Ferruginibacter sp.]